VHSTSSSEADPTKLESAGKNVSYEEVRRPLYGGSRTRVRHELPTPSSSLFISRPVVGQLPAVAAYLDGVAFATGERPIRTSYVEGCSAGITCASAGVRGGRC